MIFLCLLITLFSVMTWLALHPGPKVCVLLSLYNFSDMNYKMLIVAVAALNFLVCFVVEVSVVVKLLMIVVFNTMSATVVGFPQLELPPSSSFQIDTYRYHYKVKVLLALSMSDLLSSWTLGSMTLFVVIVTWNMQRFMFVQCLEI